MMHGDFDAAARAGVLLWSVVLVALLTMHFYNEER